MFFQWAPATEKQKAALDSEADILLLGGSAGSLKTSTMLIDLAQEHEYPTMNSYFFRRTYPELEDAIKQSRGLYSQMGGTFNETSKTWEWERGAQLHFRHCQHEKNLYDYQGHQITALGIDESTHFPIQFIRYLITRNRSTDPDINIRVRLGTNPGNESHDDHMKMFFNGTCPHCTPELAPEQGKLRFDAKWSDGVPVNSKEAGDGVPLSVSYILSNVREHNLLGQRYITNLNMQNPAVAKALLAGCWKIFEGQFFTCWEPDRKGMPMVVSRKDIDIPWWWPRWFSSDYGFSISVAAAHLFVHEPQSKAFPNGRTFVIDEMDRQLPAKDFAKEIIKRWVVDEKGQQYEYRWMPCYLSPDSFADRGGEFTLAGQMNSELEKYGLNFMPARNDRAGGAMKLYSGFQSGELVICRECEKTCSMIPSRIHDKDKENDVLKVHGHPLDDYYDDLRYGFYSYETAQAVSTPPEVKLAQAKERYDATTYMLKQDEIIKAAMEEEEPITYSRNARQFVNSKHRK